VGVERTTGSNNTAVGWKWFKLHTLGLQERSCLSPSAPLSSGLFFGYHFRYLLDDDL
jgi:hypothetical protein